ncbi:MAG: polyphosphate polymerase domain-containing protein [Lachnospirales bacterium]
MGKNWTAQRFEKKYVITEEQYLMLKERLKDITERDEFGDTTIYNIYYDTPDFKLIRKSLTKPAYKEKFRVRSYGLANENTQIFAEIKKKYLGVVYKRRIPFKFSLLEKSDYSEVRQAINKGERQILDEMAWLFEVYEGLTPKMFISYDREPLFTTDSSGIRITFDSNILYRTDNLTLDKDLGGTAILPEGMRVLELKAGDSIPIWISNILNELKIYPVSYSKYGTAYQKFCEVKKNEYVA